MTAGTQLASGLRDAFQLAVSGGTVLVTQEIPRPDSTYTLRAVALEGVPVTGNLAQTTPFLPLLGKGYIASVTDHQGTVVLPTGGGTPLTVYSSRAEGFATAGATLAYIPTSSTGASRVLLTPHVTGRGAAMVLSGPVPAQRVPPASAG